MQAHEMFTGLANSLSAALLLKAHHGSAHQTNGWVFRHFVAVQALAFVIKLKKIKENTIDVCFMPKY